MTNPAVILAAFSSVGFVAAMSGILERNKVVAGMSATLVKEQTTNTELRRVVTVQTEELTAARERAAAAEAKLSEMDDMDSRSSRKITALAVVTISAACLGAMVQMR